MVEKRERRNKLLAMFSLQDNLPAHYKLCIFNILFVIFLFTLLMYVEIILDKEIMSDTEKFPVKVVLTWFIPLCFQNTSIFAFTLFGCIYFITARLFPTNRCCFRFGTCLIGGALAFFASTIIWSWWYFIAFFIIWGQFSNLSHHTPTLFSLMIVLLILSFFNIGFVVWVASHVIITSCCEKLGLKKRQNQLMYPIKMVNDDKRTVEISQSHDARESVDVIQNHGDKI